MENVNTSSLIEKVQLIAKYYYKGFGATMDGILDNVDAYLMFDQKEIYSERAYMLFSPIYDFYEGIPFDEINDTELYPLFVVNRILPKFKGRIDDYFDNPTKSEKVIIRKQGEAIVEIGRLYDDSLHSILKEIRTNFNYQDFRVQIADDKNTIWHY